MLETPHDLLVATSMVDLATLRGLVPSLAAVPTALYFHENQFAYPEGRHRHGLLEAQMVSLYAALAADRLVFNSGFNRDSFLQGCAALLQRLPDYVPPGVVEALSVRSDIVPVPCDVDGFAEQRPAWPGAKAVERSSGDPLRLVWVGRFEHDKGGESLLEILTALESSSIDYELAVIGQQFREIPAAFETVAAQFTHRLVQYGFVESRDDYRALLAAGDIVLSTAAHEFQGLAVMEAVAAGCLPVVPDALVYPEIYPAPYRYRAGQAIDLILAIAAELDKRPPLAVDLSGWTAEALKPRYTAAFAAARDSHLSP